MVEDLYHQSAHYNLKIKAGAVFNRVTARNICGLRPQDMWVWIVEEKRNDTPNEICELCKRAPKRTSGTV